MALTLGYVNEAIGVNQYERHAYGLASIGANIAAYATLGATGGGLSALAGKAGTLGVIGNISLRVDRIVMGSQAAISSFKAGYQLKQGNYGGALGSLFNAAINVVGIKASPLRGAPAAGRWAEVKPNLSRATPTGGPKPSPKFRTPSNPAQPPPTSYPSGLELRVMRRSTEQYPNGYWRLEKPMMQGRPQGIDPSTMKPGTHPETHVPLPPPSGR